MPQVITGRETAAEAIRELAGRLESKPALACACRTLAGAVECGEDHEVRLCRAIAAFGRQALGEAAEKEAELRKQMDAPLKWMDSVRGIHRRPKDAPPIPVDVFARLRINDETGDISLCFEDEEAQRLLAEAYKLKIDDEFVRLGHCTDLALPHEYWRSHVAEWSKLTDQWLAEQADAGRRDLVRDWHNPDPL